MLLLIYIPELLIVRTRFGNEAEIRVCIIPVTSLCLQLVITLTENTKCSDNVYFINCMQISWDSSVCQRNVFEVQTKHYRRLFHIV